MMKKIVKIIFNGLTFLQWYCLRYIGGAVLIDKDGKQIHLQAPKGKHFEQGAG